MVTSRFGTMMLLLAFAALMYLLAWEGNTGKGLACVVAPYSLEVTDSTGSPPQSVH